MSTERLPQVNQLIKKELSQIMLREADFPEGALVTLTRVETSANLIQVKAYISVMPQEMSRDVLKTLRGMVYEFQQKLNGRLKMRPVPRIIFVEEEAVREAGRIEELLEKIKND
ncbi:MAG: 30S ribosome-binding factor RbfA [bacterium]|nr:30S ribosome-binding factor RbfA [bacterium]